METNVLQDEELEEISNSHLHIFQQHTNLSSNLYYVGKIGQLGIDFNADWLWSKENESNNTSDYYQETGHDAQSLLVNSVTSKYNRLLASKLELTHPL